MGASAASFCVGPILGKSEYRFRSHIALALLCDETYYYAIWTDCQLVPDCRGVLRSNKNFSLISHPLSPTFIVCQSDREMSGTPCEPANLLLIRNLGMDFSTYIDPIPNDGNKDGIVNEDNDKAQEPQMHKDITIHDEGNKIKESNI